MKNNNPRTLLSREINPGPLNTAVLFLVFNRPDTTTQVFDEIRKAEPPRLYIAADGPRTNREGETEMASKNTETEHHLIN